MIKLLKKEFLLAMHPTVPLMLLLSALVLVPNYPYVVIFFFVSMSIFNTCLSGRENNDIIYSLNLPVAQKNIVKSRIMFTSLIELFQLILIIPFSTIKHIFSFPENLAGMDANLSLYSIGFISYGLFNLVFFTSYYKKILKVGFAFVKSSILFFIIVTVDVISTYAVPFVRDYLDTPDFDNLYYKIIFLIIGAFIFTILTLLSYYISKREFKKQDIN